MTFHYLNLTNGLESLMLFGANVRFIRIRSTWCEQKRWADILRDIDTDLLWHLASGHTCYVHDYSNGASGVPRSIWQGLPWIKFALGSAWGIRGPAVVRGVNCTNYFSEQYRSLPTPVVRKMVYFRNLLRCDSVRLIGVANRTTHDGDFYFYRSLLGGRSVSRLDEPDARGDGGKNGGDDGEVLAVALEEGQSVANEPAEDREDSGNRGLRHGFLSLEGS